MCDKLGKGKPGNEWSIHTTLSNLQYFRNHQPVIVFTCTIIERYSSLTKHEQCCLMRLPWLPGLGYYSPEFKSTYTTDTAAPGF